MEHSLDPRLVGQILAATEERGARGGKPAREEAATVEPLLAHGFFSAGSMT